MDQRANILMKMRKPMQASFEEAVSGSNSSAILDHFRYPYIDSYRHRFERILDLAKHHISLFTRSLLTKIIISISLRMLRTQLKPMSTRYERGPAIFGESRLVLRGHDYLRERERDPEMISTHLNHERYHVSCRQSERGGEKKQLVEGVLGLFQIFMQIIP